jgi:deoxyribodipyrimidine photolyase-related protein
MTTLRIILEDQLSLNISSLVNVDKEKDVIILRELNDYFTKVKHHKQKVVFLLSSMRHFALELKDLGYRVDFLKIHENTGSLEQELLLSYKTYNPTKMIITMPSDYDTISLIQGIQKNYNIEILEDDRFLCSVAEFKEWALDKKQLRMEYFYRIMRKKYNILMSIDSPIGGQWNYDEENRKTPKELKDTKIPNIKKFHNDEITLEVIDFVNKNFQDHFGNLDNFFYATTREGAKDALENFFQERAKMFGEYQDAMIDCEPFMYHSVISLYLNAGLLNPLECARKAEEYYKLGLIPLNAAEGFIRQLIGWREYIRGVYFTKMPEYKEKNSLNAMTKLPSFYWDGKTDMNCIKSCVAQTIKYGYAHHIQRLMVLGNFALLIGATPKEVNEWFLIVYVDAYEWVEMPNVTGMILYADDGYLASKPYAASGSYINTMSNYCKNCKYDVKEKLNSSACPFNYLYWYFLARNREKLSNNHRMSFMYKTYDKMSDEKKELINELSINFIKKIT